MLHLGQVAEDTLAGEEGRLGGVKPMAGQCLRNWCGCQVSAHIDRTWKLQTKHASVHMTILYWELFYI